MQRKMIKVFVLLSVMCMLSFLLLTSYAGAQTMQCTCDSCHGNPPVGDAHDHFSKIKQGLTCDSCHFGGMPTTPITDTKFQIGFSVNGKDGTGMTYDGLAHPVLGATYEGTNNTTITQNGTMKCSNVYCHGGGTGGTNNTGGISKSPSLNIGDPRPIAASLSPSWTNVTPIGCDYCHGYPPSYQNQPKANSHAGHSGVGCHVCHYATTHDDVTIYDVTKHHNGIYDVTPDPNFIVLNKPLNFTYSYDAGGGKCSNVTCHGGSTGYWGSPTMGSTGMGTILNATTGSACYQINATATPTAGSRGPTSPYTYDWDWGDGNNTTGPSSTAPITASHTYAYKTGTYYITFNYRDSNNITGSSAPFPVSPKSVNVSPVANSVIPVGVKGYTVTFIDMSYDPDYNLCGHSGAGSIYISWADGSSTNQSINLTDKPSNQVYSHTYTRASTFYLTHAVYDNVGYSGNDPNSIVVTVPSTFTISGKITHAGGGSYTPGQAFSGVTVEVRKKDGTYVASVSTKADGTYTITAIPETEHYDVIPSRTGFTFSPVSVDVYQTTTDANFTGTP